MVVPNQAALGKNKWPIGRRQVPEEPSDDFFRVTQAIDGCRVDTIDSAVNRSLHRLYGCRIILGTPAECPAVLAMLNSNALASHFT